MKKFKKLLKKVTKQANVFVAPNATVLGNVTLEKNASVWFGAVLRGDSDAIIIGENTNIQDNAVIHCDPDFPAIVGNHCTIGHGAIVHGCTIGNNVLIGMNATILNEANIGNNCIIGANSLVTSGTEIPEGSLVMGIPAKVIKALDEKQILGIQLNADVYVKKAMEYKKLLK